MDVSLQDMNAEALETFLGVATARTCRHAFLDWLGGELRGELARRKRGGEPVVLRLPDLPLAELGAGVTICDVIARRFSEHAERPTSAESLHTLRECARLAVAVGIGCLQELDRQTARDRVN